MCVLTRGMQLLATLLITSESHPLALLEGLDYYATPFIRKGKRSKKSFSIS